MSSIYAFSASGFAGTPLLRRVMENIKRNGDRIAVVDGETELSYAGLGLVAASISDALAARGYTPERAVPAVKDGVPNMLQTVGVRLPRSAANVAAWLGIAMTGSAYVPIALDWPQERVARLAERAGIRTLVCDPDLSSPELPGIERLDVRHFIGAASKVAPVGAPPEPRHCRDDIPLYVIHTSGSTGEPKGVVVSHANTFAVLEPCEEYGMLPHDRTAHTIAPTFDLAMMEVWGSLLHCCTIVVADTPVTLDAEAMRRLTVNCGVNWSILSTGVFNLLAAQNPTALASLRHICICGEMPNREAVKRVWNACPGTAIQNCYGPAECTIYASAETMTASVLENSILPAGRSISAARLYIADDDLCLLPPEAVGEVLIGGACVGPGYLNDVEKTSRVFVRLPEVGRVYRTGDYGKLSADGVLTLFGRRDNQVKISGHRVELGEVCALLMQAPGVKNAHAALVKREDVALAAYLVPQEGRAGNAFIEEVKSFLRTSAPDYLIPAFWFVLDRLPLNAHGKTDESRLPQPPTLNAGDGSILGFFRQELGIDTYSEDDSFFEAGGTSVQAARLIIRVRELTSVAVPFTLLAQPGTVRAVSDFIEQQRVLGSRGESRRFPGLTRKMDSGGASGISA